VGVPGSGTTWLSHIMHGLRSDGSAMVWWKSDGSHGGHGGHEYLMKMMKSG
jgi:hypothetical protein